MKNKNTNCEINSMFISSILIYCGYKMDKNINYEIKIFFGEYSGGQTFKFEWKLDGGTYSSDLSSLFKIFTARK